MKYDDRAAQQALIGDLSIFLDAREAELLETLGRLNTLRAAVIRRDEAALTQLLDAVQEDADRKRRLDAAQEAIEQRLLEGLAGLILPVTLSGICTLIDESLRPTLRQKQMALQHMAQRVQHELQATEMLLRECARCNRELLGVLLGCGRPSQTYDPQGQSQWNVHHGLVSMKL